MNDYQKTITVSKPASEVYAAITVHISDWWSNDLTGAAVQIGDSFTISFGKTQKTFYILETVLDEKVVWKCVKAYINNPSLQNKAEWVGTNINWTLVVTDHNTTLTFLHEGLNENFECYKLCEAGWEMFLASLKAYLETGKGSPFLKAETIEDGEQKKQLKV